MKILVVEDDAKLARFIVRVLVEEGYIADACAEGQEASLRAASGIYDAMLLDWMLPDIDGLSVVRSLREQGCTIPVVMLTARGELRERVLGLRSGADDYVVKPFEIDELLARLDAVLRRSVRKGLFRVGPLELDRLERRVLLAGQRLELTEREMALLTHLVLKADQVVTRSELLLRVWGMRFDPESNMIDVHVSRLRDKLGAHAKLIETVRGKGYRLRSEAPP